MSKVILTVCPLLHTALVFYLTLYPIHSGTTSNGSCVLRFRRGAFVPGASVLPVALAFPFRHFSPTFESIYVGTFIVRLLSQVKTTAYECLG